MRYVVRTQHRHETRPGHHPTDEFIVSVNVEAESFRDAAAKRLAQLNDDSRRGCSALEVRQGSIHGTKSVIYVEDGAVV